MVQYVNKTIKCGFMMCDCGKYYGDRCENGCTRQKEMLERTNAHLQSAMENLTKSYFETKQGIEVRLPGLTGEPYNQGEDQ